jgi:hypothetical protein
MFTQETNAGRRWLAHGRDPNFAPWIDTVQLDYRQPATRAAMQSELMRIAERCDGVRCDMAMLILNDVFANTWKGFPPVGAPTEGGTVRNDLPEFWLDAIRAVKQAHPEFLFLAEVYWGMEQRLQSHGFDYTYDKVLYDELIHRNPVAVQRHLLDSSPVYVAAGAHFLENHDEARIASILSLPEHRAAAALILTLPGMRLLHEGQLQGAQVRLPVQLTCRPAEPAQREVAGMYEQLLQAVKRAGVGQGSWCLLKPRAAWPDNPTAQDFVLVQWQSAPDDFVLAVINLAPHPSQCYAPLEVVGLETTEWQIADLIGTEKHRRLGNELVEKGLFLDLPAHGAQLLQFSPARA